MIPVPAYLKHNAVIIKQAKSWTQFSFFCNCGCRYFFVYENFLTKQEKDLLKPYEDALTDSLTGCWGSTMTINEDGTRHYWKLYTPLGLNGPKKEVFIPEIPSFLGISVVKVQCFLCGKEHILFDNRYHGYDGVTGVKIRKKLDYLPHFKHKCRTAVTIEIKVENDLSLPEFQENTGLEYDEAQYSNAFGWIAIYSVNSVGKRRKIFEAETA